MCVLTNPRDLAAFNKSHTPYRLLTRSSSPPSTAFPFPHLAHSPASCIASPSCPSSVPKKLGSPTPFASRQQQQRTLRLVTRSLVIDNLRLPCPFLFPSICPTQRSLSLLFLCDFSSSLFDPISKRRARYRLRYHAYTRTFLPSRLQLTVY